MNIYQQKTTLRIGLATVLSTILLVCTQVTAQELLTNSGFETGDLSGWAEIAGQGHVVTSSANPGMNPDTPRTGSFMFSASTSDGAVLFTPEITISQVIDVSTSTIISDGVGAVKAQAFFVGSINGTNPSNDTAQVVIEFLSGGPSGVSLDSFSTAPLDPILGFWNEVNTPEIDVPALTDTIIFNVVTKLDPGFTSIDIGVDDLSLQLIPEPTTFTVLAIGGLALLRRQVH